VAQTASSSVTLSALTIAGSVEAGIDLAGLVARTIETSGTGLRDHDVVILAQKIVSKAQGRRILLSTVTPSAKAVELASVTGKDARLLELILSESTKILRVRKGLIIVRHRLGMVMANAGIDQSNVDHGAGEAALLLPMDPDGTCAEIRARLSSIFRCDPAVMIIDSLGRAWRQGTIGTAIGVSGMPGLLDLRGHADLFGRPLQTTEVGFADEIAAGASALMGQASEGRPLVLARGYAFMRRNGNAAELIRPVQMDLFP
jgi:coenzyme F420-0:L-glutamate ligase/coenzyme F420-1:gamma-L-glutamate ligase